MVLYPSTLDVPYELVEHVSWPIHARQREVGTRWRRLRCFKQALLALAHLRKNETFAQVGAGFGVSQSTAWRYVDETLEILASWVPGLWEALAGLDEGDFVIVDGTVRHEALDDRAGVEGLRRRTVAAVWLKLRAA